MSTETIEQLCQRIMDARGYLVVNSACQLAVGAIIEELGQRNTIGEETLQHKTVVIAETEAQDHVDQCEFVGVRRGYGAYPYFYRVIAE